MLNKKCNILLIENKKNVGYGDLKIFKYTTAGKVKWVTIIVNIQRR